MSYCITFKDVQDAARRIEGIAHRTPVMTSESINDVATRRTLPPASEMTTRNLFFKLEALQKTGSFKFRGALNAITCLLEEQQEGKDDDDGTASSTSDDGSNNNKTKMPFAVVAHSSGNHAQAVALATKLAAANVGKNNNKKKNLQDDVEAHIAMPENTPTVKKDAVVAFGGNVHITGNSNLAREDEADRLVAEFAPRSALIHPSEDPYVIAGQGTVCLEFVDQLRDEYGIDCPDVVIIPVGGGGLASGNAVTLRAMLGNKVKIVLAEPYELDDAYRSFYGKKLVGHYPNNQLDSVADGLKTTLGPNTYPIVRDHVDDIYTVSEYEILTATKLVWERLKVCIEPSAGVGVAVALFSDDFQEKYPPTKYPNVGVVLCGGNVDVIKIASMMESLGVR